MKSHSQRGSRSALDCFQNSILKTLLIIRYYCPSESKTHFINDVTLLTRSVVFFNLNSNVQQQMHLNFNDDTISKKSIIVSGVQIRDLTQHDWDQVSLCTLFLNFWRMSSCIFDDYSQILDRSVIVFIGVSSQQKLSIIHNFQKRWVILWLCFVFFNFFWLNFSFLEVRLLLLLEKILKIGNVQCPIHTFVLLCLSYQHHHFWILSTLVSLSWKHMWKLQWEAPEMLCSKRLQMSFFSMTTLLLLLKA